MEKGKCDKCGKVIEAYTKEQLKLLLFQHSWKHKRGSNKNENK